MKRVILLVALALAVLGTGCKEKEAAHATPVSSETTISGSAWLSRNSGGSDLLRGLHIQLLKPTMDTTGVVAAMERSAIEHQKGADEAWARLKVEKAKPAPSKAAIDNDQKYADDWTAKVVAIRNQAATLGKTADTGAAFKGAVVGAWGGPAFAEFIQPIVMMDTTTDADGKYRLEHVAAGSYYLHAKLETEAVAIEWVIPVKASGGTLTINLDNQAAGYVHNRSN